MTFDELEAAETQARQNRRIADQARLDTVMAEQLAAIRIRERNGFTDPYRWTVVLRRLLWLALMLLLGYWLIVGLVIVGPMVLG